MALEQRSAVVCGWGLLKGGETRFKKLCCYYLKNISILFLTIEIRAQEIMTAKASVLPRLQVEELALQSMISSREENVTASSSAAAEEAQEILGQMDNEAAINQTELHLGLQGHEEEEEEEDEESDS
ncbi:snRNA-activating protein complex subunit 5 [Egretta garzetta]|uniref:snRNA-activating protein complex subunit 5 n=1 Tax=Egretta garzetta TaxID=188379 RepID=UPI00163C3194|nr:snRNA-activating protein complex subunit 5 [Egretta garzetta]